MFSITVTQKDLLSALAAVKRAVPGKSTLPVLECVKLEAKRNRIAFTATDLDIAVLAWVEGQVEGEGALAVPFKKLETVVKQVQGTLRLTQEGKDKNPSLKLRDSTTFVVKLNAIAAEEFPTLPAHKPDHTVTLSGDQLNELARVNPFASTEESRPIIQGTLLEFRPTETRAVATNGHRMAIRILEVANKLPKPKTGTDAPNVIIPPRALDLAASLFADVDAVTIDWKGDGRHVRFSNGVGYIWTRTIEGPFPRYEQVIPRENDKSVVVDVEPLLKMLARLKPFTSDHTRRMRLTFDGNGMMQGQAKTPDLGEATDTLPVTYEGTPLEIGFNLDYLTQLIRALDTETVVGSFKSPEQASMWWGHGGSSQSFKILMMPLRLVD